MEGTWVSLNWAPAYEYFSQVFCLWVPTQPSFYFQFRSKTPPHAVQAPLLWSQGWSFNLQSSCLDLSVALNYRTGFFLVVLIFRNHSFFGSNFRRNHPQPKKKILKNFHSEFYSWYSPYISPKGTSNSPGSPWVLCCLCMPSTRWTHQTPLNVAPWRLWAWTKSRAILLWTVTQSAFISAEQRMASFHSETSRAEPLLSTLSSSFLLEHSP